jgi:hypothetical protein
MSRSKKAMAWVGGKLVDAAKAKLAGTPNVTWNCCGGKGKHVNGCDGEIHEGFQGTGHSGEYFMTLKELSSFKAQGGKYRSAKPDGEGGFAVHVSKFPPHWSR